MIEQIVLTVLFLLLVLVFAGAMAPARKSSEAFRRAYEKGSKSKPCRCPVCRLKAIQKIRAAKALRAD